MKIQLRALLASASGVSSIVGSRIDWGSGSQGAPMPYVVLWLVSEQRDHNIRSGTGPYTARVQVDVYAETFGQAEALSQAVSNALDGHQDSTFQRIFHAGERGGREGGTNEVMRPFYVKIDFIITHNPTEA